MALYWYGGSGNWSDYTNHWSNNSGNSPASPAGAAPSTTDDVVFDTASHSGAYTVTIDANANCANFTMDNPASGVVTLGAATSTSYTLSCYGNFSMATSSLCTFAGTLAFRKTSGTNTITTNSVSLACGVTLNASGGTYQLAGNLTMGGLGKNLIYNAGTFDANTKLVSFTNPSVCAIQGAWTFYDLTITGTAAFCAFSLTGNIVVSNTFTVTGSDAGKNRVLIRSNAIGTARTITANGTIALTNVDFRDITGAGSVTWSGTSIGNAGGNSNISFATPVTRYWENTTSSGNWSDVNYWKATTGGATGASVPICHDSVIINADSGGSAFTSSNDCGGGVADITVDNSNCTINLGSGIAGTIYGSLTLTSCATFGQNNAQLFAGRGTHTVTMNGKNPGNTWTFSAPGGSYDIQDQITTGQGLTLTAGTLSFNNISNTWKNLNASSVLVSTVLTLGSGTTLLTDTSGNVFSAETGTDLTITATTGTIKFTGTGTGEKTFAGGGKNYGTVWFSGSGTGSYTITGSNTFAGLKTDAAPGAIKTIQFTASTTTILSSSAGWELNGDASYTNVIKSKTSASHTLSCASGTIQASYCNISYSTATGGATWDAYSLSGNVDGGNTSGWLWSAPGANVYGLLLTGCGI
jgi:hypothetical protein